MRQTALRLLFCLLFTAATPLLAHAADNRLADNRAADSRAAAAPETPAVPVIKPSLDERLRGVIDSIERRQRELTELRKQRAKEPSPELDQQIEQTSQQIADLRQQFVGLATNDFSLLDPQQSPTLTINWQDELIQVIYPLLREVNDLTAKPRQIEHLKMEISLFDSQANVLNAANTQLKTVLTDSHDTNVRRALTLLGEELAERHIENEQKLTALRHELDELQRDSVPLWSSILHGARSFITNVGLHFGLALLLGISAYYLIQLIGRLALRTVRGGNEKRLAAIERLIVFVIQALGWLIGLFTYMMVLYALDSWVILGLTVIVLLGMAFSLKNVLPDYMVEIRTLLNFGSIRQGERLNYNNLPWRIAELDVYTTLHNPALDALLRVPLTQLSKLSSRPYHADEPWFPCQSGEWVLLSDGIYGQVRMQSADAVLLNVGESTVSYRTENFLDARPQNMSRGFTVATTFGLDYSHQAASTTVIPEQLRADLEQWMKQQDFGAHCIYLGVELSNAAASSLDFRLIATFKGAAAERYSRIQRWLQRSAVESANRHGWAIPFPQIVVHGATPESAGSTDTQPHNDG